MSYDEHQAMWPQMIAALAAIDAELGLPEDGCNSLAQTLAAIRALKASAEIAKLPRLPTPRLLASGAIAGKRVELHGWHIEDIEIWERQHGLKFGA